MEKIDWWQGCESWNIAEWFVHNVKFSLGALSSPPPFHSHLKQQKADTIIGTFLLNKSECKFAYNVCELWGNVTGTCTQK